MGVPQGRVLSPLLFNIYLAKIPSPSYDVSMVTYSDDCTIISSVVKRDDINANITQYLAPSWMKEVKKFLDISKTDSFLGFTTQKYWRQYSSLFSHATYINQKVRNRNKVLKALVGITASAGSEI